MITEQPLGPPSVVRVDCLGAFTVHCEEVKVPCHYGGNTDIGVSGRAKMEARPSAPSTGVLIVLRRGPATEHLRAETGLCRGLVIPKAVQEIKNLSWFPKPLAS